MLLANVLDVEVGPMIQKFSLADVPLGTGEPLPIMLSGTTVPGCSTVANVGWTAGRVGTVPLKFESWYWSAPTLPVTSVQPGEPESGVALAPWMKTAPLVLPLSVTRTGPVAHWPLPLRAKPLAGPPAPVSQL